MNLKFRLSTLALVLGLTLSACSADTSSAAPDTSSESSDSAESTGAFVPVYDEAGSDTTAAEATFLQERRVLEDFTDVMNGFVSIPNDVQVVAQDCGEVNAFYFESDHLIQLCYELGADERESFTDAGETADEVDESVYQSTISTLYHEAGHALIGELDLAVTGREEDVADQMAAYVLTYDDASKEALLATADSYALSAQRNGAPDDRALADTHSLDAQRSVNFLCYVYGSDEKTFGYLVDEEILDADRATGCKDEYDLLVRAWDSLLEPYFVTS